MEASWIVRETGFDPVRLHHHETVFTLGNGYLGTRGAFEEGYPGAWPATLIHGVFDDAPVAYTELANSPNWLPLGMSIDGERFRLDRGEILHYQRQLDLRRGVLSRGVRWRSPNGLVVELHFQRFVSLADPHVLAIHCQVTMVNQEATVEAQASIDGYPDSMGLMHWEWVEQGKEDVLSGCAHELAIRASS